MKKLFLLLSLVSIVFTSCSSEDNNEQTQQDTEGTLLKKTIISSGSSVLETAEYFYNGNKLAQIKRSATDFTNYNYTNNLITGAEKFVNNNLVSTIALTYNSDEKLIQTVTLSNQTNLGYKVTYVYNSDNTISITEFEGDFANQNIVVGEYKVYLQDGLVIKREQYKLINGILETLTRHYSYDDKNSPFNSIVGYNKLTFFELGSFGNTKNILSITYSATNTSNTNQLTSIYTYNSFGYPISKIDDNLSGTTTSTQLFYQ